MKKIITVIMCMFFVLSLSACSKSNSKSSSSNASSKKASSQAVTEDGVPIFDYYGDIEAYNYYDWIYNKIDTTQDVVLQKTDNDFLYLDFEEGKISTVFHVVTDKYNSNKQYKIQQTIDNYDGDDTISFSCAAFNAPEKGKYTTITVLNLHNINGLDPENDVPSKVQSYFVSQNYKVYEPEQATSSETDESSSEQTATGEQPADAQA